jgi:ribosome-associated toxin RatA of RatAB toxin-antitoxin module
MPVVQDSLIIKAPQEPLFRLLQDYGLRLRWDPFLKEMRFLDGATAAAVGVRTVVKAWNGLSMETIYTTLSSPEVVAMKMTEGPRFFSQFAGSWRLEPAGPGEVKVTFRYSFTTRWPWLRAMLDPVIKRVFARDIRGRLAGLKRGAEEAGLLAQLPPVPMPMDLKQ